MVQTVPKKKKKPAAGAAVCKTGGCDYQSGDLKSFTVRLPAPLYTAVREYCWHHFLTFQEVAFRAFLAFIEGGAAAAVRAHDFADTTAAEREVLRNCLDLLRAGPGSDQSRDILLAVSRNWRKYTG